MQEAPIKIITFYEFKELSPLDRLRALRSDLRALMMELEIKGTVILASEGFNATISGDPGAVDEFCQRFESLFDTKLDAKVSIHNEKPFRKSEVKIKPEIVTLKKPVDIRLGAGTHVTASEWNEIISDPETVVLDTRNDYEFRTGTFRGAVNPETEKFSDLPGFVETRLDPALHKKVAMFCTGGIRCEKFAPYMKQLGFENVYQLEGGILRYLEEIPDGESQWTGECFVFDNRVSVDSRLMKGSAPDRSQETAE